MSLAEQRTEMYTPPNHAPKPHARESWHFGHSAECAAMRAMVRAILSQPHTHKWTVQGFGMLRTYLPDVKDPKRFRLNVWSRALAVPNVSIIHDHPWHFDSWIINGEFRNQRFVEDYYNGTPYHWQVIQTGEGGGPTANRYTMGLRGLELERYTTGDKYHQDSHEIHLSDYDEGTVTLNDRIRVGTGEHARVFWPCGTNWVDAEPRPATTTEIEHATTAALAKWEA